MKSLTKEEVTILKYLANGKKKTYQNLCQNINTNDTALQSILESLESKNLITSIHSDNRKWLLISISKIGTSLLVELNKCWYEKINWEYWFPQTLTILSIIITVLISVI